MSFVLFFFSFHVPYFAKHLEKKVGREKGGSLHIFLFFSQEKNPAPLDTQITIVGRKHEVKEKSGTDLLSAKICPSAVYIMCGRDSVYFVALDNQCELVKWSIYCPK